MKKIYTAIASLCIITASHAGLYYCKSEAHEFVKTKCVLVVPCSGTCEIDTWTRGYCGMLASADCYSLSSTAGGTATVTQTFRICTTTYGCACDRGNVDHTTSYTGKVDQCSPNPIQVNPGTPGT